MVHKYRFSKASRVLCRIFSTFMWYSRKSTTQTNSEKRNDLFFSFWRKGERNYTFLKRESGVCTCQATGVTPVPSPLDSIEVLDVSSLVRFGFRLERFLFSAREECSKLAGRGRCIFALHGHRAPTRAIVLLVWVVPRDRFQGERGSLVGRRINGK